MALGQFSKYKSLLLYGAAMAVLLFVLKWIEWRFLIFTNSFEIYAGLIAVVFTGLGIWLTLKLNKPKTTIVTIEKEILLHSKNFVLNTKALEDTSISKRELDVLELMAKGLSNQQIADQLFVSLNTVKTHTSSLFYKLEVQRRTQAVEKARRLNLIS